MSTILLYAPAVAHTREHHPENHRRLRDFLPFLEQKGVLSDLTQVEGAAAAERQVTRVHTQRLLEQVRQASRAGGQLIDADTYTTVASYQEALVAAGSCCVAVDRVMVGEARNGLVVIRPPGHHAERDRPGGFCLFNNVAIAARQAQAVHGAKRVLILDFDVHHGNGTQDIFYADENVLFISLHLYHPFFYPGTGDVNELGRGAGRGSTLNIPFPAHVGDKGYREAFSEIVLPRAREFAPELILISAGFDAHWQDPLASAGLSLSGYAYLSRLLLELADEVCEGRILFVLEGGYLLGALRYGLLNVLYALTGRDEISDPLGPAPFQEEGTAPLMERLREVHLLNYS